MINISDCPITGLKRQITHKDLFVSETDKEVVLYCYISHFKDGVLVENSRITSYQKVLRATEQIPVNKKTGEKVESFDDPNAIGQYSFFKYLTTLPVAIENLELKYIGDNDLEGNFDI
jgi:hypothetical protein